jgi:hypothetical protein
MAGYSIEAVKENLANIGKDNERLAQKEAADTAVTSYRDIVFSDLTAEGVKDFVATHRGTIQDKVNEGIKCGNNLNASFESLTEKLLSALFDNSLIDALQDLTDNLQIIPPGFGLPPIDFGFDFPSIDLGISINGGFDIGDWLGLGELLNFEPFRLPGCDSMLPDISTPSLPSAPAIPAKIMKDLTGQELDGKVIEGMSGGLANPHMHVGNFEIKKQFDEGGNPFLKALKLGEKPIEPRYNAREEPDVPTIKMGTPNRDDQSNSLGSLHSYTPSSKIDETAPQIGTNTAPTFVNNRLEVNKNTDIKSFANGQAYVESGGLKIAVLKENDGSFIAEEDYDPNE